MDGIFCVNTFTINPNGGATATEGGYIKKEGRQPDAAPQKPKMQLSAAEVEESVALYIGGTVGVASIDIVDIVKEEPLSSEKLSYKQT